MTTTELDGAARLILTLLADAAVRSVAFAGAAGLVILVLRRQGAATRLRAWTFVLGALVTLPALALVMPAWHWPIPDVPAVSITRSISLPSELVEASSSVPPDQAYAGATTPVSSLLSPAMVCAAIYLAGVLLLMLRAGIGLLASRRLRRSAAAVTDPHAMSILRARASVARLTHTPLLVESPRVLVPITMSVVRPIIALPADWRDWPTGRLDAVVTHEVSHVARRDALTRRVALLYRAVLWCSPLSWWLQRHLAELAEEASDEGVLRSGVDRATYAEALLDCFVRLQRGPRRADWQVSMARRVDADAERRLERILMWTPGSTETHSRRWLGSMAVIVASVAGVTASVRPTPPPAISIARSVSSTHRDVNLPIALPDTPARPESPRDGRHDNAASQPAPQQRRQVQTVAPPKVASPKAVSQQDEDFAAGAYEGDAPGIVAPRVLASAEPRYTSEAMRARIQGDVEVEAIVLPDGSVGRVRVSKSLDAMYGLDEEALSAAKRWKFTPALLGDQPVAVRVVFALGFRIHFDAER